MWGRGFAPSRPGRRPACGPDLHIPGKIGTPASRLVDWFVMAKPVPLGVRGETEQKVAFQHTLTYHDPQLPPVYSTPHMIALMEQAAFRALQPYCEGDEISVGTAINIEHRAATGVGALVRAEAILESANGRFYVFRVSARDDKQEIGCGTVSRAVVSLGRFMQRVAKSST